MKKGTAETKWRAIRARLEARQTWIVESIRDYPPPITGCDAQFDHLLEQRDGISHELKRLETARQSGGAVQDFTASSNWIEKDAALSSAQNETAALKPMTKGSAP